MSGYRVSVDVHHVPGQADDREFFVVFNGWSNWRLTADEARELYANLGLKLAASRIDEWPWIDEWDEEVEFDEEPSEDELTDALDVIYANCFPGSWERVEDGVS